MFDLDLSGTKTYNIKVGRFEVSIKPLGASEELKVKNVYTKRASFMKAPRTKDEHAELALDEFDSLGFQKALAQKTWKSWNASESGKKKELSDANIDLFFEFYSDLALEVINEFDRVRLEENKEFEEEKKTS